MVMSSYSKNSKAKTGSTKGTSKTLSGPAMYTKVSQATIDKIKKMGMTAALKSAPTANAEMAQGLRRMYGADRVKAAMAANKPSRAVMARPGSTPKSNAPGAVSGKKASTSSSTPKSTTTTSKSYVGGRGGGGIVTTTRTSSPSSPRKSSPLLDIASAAKKKRDAAAATAKPKAKPSMSNRRSVGRGA
jgi:hypothetical protein